MRSSRELLAVGIFSNGSLGDRIETLLRRGREFSTHVSATRVAMSGLALLGFVAVGALAPRWIAFAQPAPRPEFEVASIRLRTEVSNRFGFGPLPGGRLSVTNNALRNVIDNAYDIQAFQLSGGPDWINTDRYDIEAKAAGNPSWPEMKPMLRSLLEDRFKLKVHRETKELPIYVLGVAKGGLKLHLLTNENCIPPDRGNPTPPPANYCGNNLSRGNGWTANNIGMSEAAGLLTAVLRRQVIDKTGITGTFDVHLEWAPENLERPTDNAANDGTLPSIFTALQEELGLKLDSSKGPVEVLVIDHIERPDAN
jgi:uncharacterized protein (TIGR03435 family)